MPHTWHDGVFADAINWATKISIHMPHTWHDGAFQLVDGAVQISIHMPHTWHDRGRGALDAVAGGISIHMPHTWHDLPLNHILP